MDNNTQAEFRLAAQVPRPASYTGPKRRCAVFTLQRDEFYQLPLWLKYYGSQFDPEDMYVIDHQSALPEIWEVLENSTVHVRSVQHEQIYDSDWYVRTVCAFRDELMQRYEYVLYTDVDEWVIPKEGSLRDFIATADKDAYRCTGYEVIEDKMYPWHDANKPLLARIPLTWEWGCHDTKPSIPVTDDLFMYHLHRLNYEAAWKKRQRYQVHPNKYHLYQEVVDEERYRQIFNTNGTQDGPAEPWHNRLTRELIGVAEI